MNQCGWNSVDKIRCVWFATLPMTNSARADSRRPGYCPFLGVFMDLRETDR